MARRAGQSRVILCTGWARIVDDAEDMVNGRAVVEKQRPIRGEAVEQFVACGLSGYLGTCHQICLRNLSTSFWIEGSIEGEDVLIWLHRKEWQLHFALPVTFRRLLWPGFLAGRAMHMAIRE